MSGLKGKGDESQMNTLIYCVGEEADDILCFFRCWKMTKRNAKK